MPNIYNKLYQTENYYGKPIKKVMELLEESSGKRLLDVGCGQGRYAIPLAMLGKEVCAVDNSELAISFIKSVVPEHNFSMEIHHQDAYDLDRFERFDIILLSEFFHFNKHEINREFALLNKMISGLKKGAKMMIIIHDLDDDQSMLLEKCTKSEELFVIHQESTVQENHQMDFNQKSMTGHFILYFEKR